MQRPLLIALLLIFCCSLAAQAAPPRPRPYSGLGVLALKPEPGAERLTVVLYQEPGVARVAELDASSLPRLAGNGAEPLLAVAARKGNWARVAYDEAGREGWLELVRSWQYLSWPEFLPGRQVAPLPGLKKGWYLMRSEPGGGGEERGSLTRDQVVRVLQVADDWARLEAPSGWFRWRDPDGRLTISLKEWEGAEKR